MSDKYVPPAFVKPAPGLQVRDPATLALIPADGLPYDETNLDHVRLLNAGDLVATDPPAPTPPKKGA